MLKEYRRKQKSAFLLMNGMKETCREEFIEQRFSESFGHGTIFNSVSINGSRMFCGLSFTE
jgi:hypothetical protein